jgi:L,D-peptidoglycan transpeptidase YkuD (ErfK/YbiS/YcfS/YnhG family)
MLAAGALAGLLVSTPGNPGVPSPRVAAAMAATAACPANVAQGLARHDGAVQLVTVEAPGWASTSAQVELWVLRGGCWRGEAGPWAALIGSAGFSDHHREGDRTTPTGIYSLGRTIYGNAPDPGVHTAYHRLVCGDWWDEDPTSPAYNTFQHVPCGHRPPFGGASEALWLDTHAYARFAVIDYNTRPAVPYAGSAIFLHASTGAPGEGCVTMPLSDLDRLLRALRWSTVPVIAMGPGSEISRF